MVKKILFSLTLIIFIGTLKVNASTVGGHEADSPLYSVVSSGYNNVAVRLWTPNIFGADVVDYGTVVNDYVYVTGCTDMPTLGYSYTPFYNNTTGSTASATDIRYAGNLTSKTCTFNTGAQGKVVYLKFRLVSDLLNVPQGTSSSTWLYNDYITLYIGTNRAFSFSIQNIVALDDDIDIYSNDFDVTLLEQQNQQIINNQNNNTNSIINNQNSNASAIIGSVAGSSQDIINNQNQNTQQEIESQKVCSNFTIDKSSVITNGKIVLSNGSLGDNNLFGVTDFIDISNSTDIVNIKPITYTDTNTNAYFCTYDSSKTVVNCYSHPNYSNKTISVSSNEKYARFSILLSSNIPQFTITICKNGNQVLNESVNGLNDTLNSDISPDTEGYLDGFSENVASDTPITDLITMPLTLINAYINGMNSSCTSYTFGSLLGTNLTMPCINLQQRLGSNIWNIVDVLFSIFMIFNISKLFIGAFNNFTSLKDDFSNMYTNDYQPKHGGDD